MVALLGLPVAPAFATDGDDDGIDDAGDNCVAAPNDSQCDTDVDGYGNLCDGDFDQDYFILPSDWTLINRDFTTTALDVDGIGTDMDCDGYVLPGDLSRFLFMFHNSLLPGPSGLSCAGTVPCDADRDGDSVMDDDDNCVLVPNPPQIDDDEDGYGTACDTDLDGDGLTTQADVDMYACAINGWYPAGDLDNDDSPGLPSDFTYLESQLGEAPGLSGRDTTPFVPSPLLADPDADGLETYRDKCSTRPSADPIESWDGDKDGVGRVCDADYNNDGFLDSADTQAISERVQSGPYDPQMDHDGDEFLGQADLTFAEELINAGIIGPSGLPCPPGPAVPRSASSLHNVLRGASWWASYLTRLRTTCT